MWKKKNRYTATKPKVNLFIKFTIITSKCETVHTCKWQKPALDVGLRRVVHKTSMERKHQTCETHYIG